jgi:hypothetical protein
LLSVLSPQARAKAFLFLADFSSGRTASGLHLAPSRSARHRHLPVIVFCASKSDPARFTIVQAAARQVLYRLCLWSFGHFLWVFKKAQF